MEVRLLGRFDVVADGGAIALGGPRQRAVLAVLAIHANEIISTDRLAEQVWAGDLPATAVVTMQRYISLLRRALHGLPAAIETARPGYMLRIDPACIDARTFERLVDEGRGLLSAGDPESAARVLRDALSLWRGEALADFAYDDFARIEINRLQELRTAALELRIDADLARGRHRDLIPELEALVAGAPLRESHRGQLMRALHRAGRRGEALRVYQQGRRAMVEEMGLEPGAELQAIEREILCSDVAEVRPAAGAAATTSTDPRAGTKPTASADATASATANPTSSSADPTSSSAGPTSSSAGPTSAEPATDGAANPAATPAVDTAPAPEAAQPTTRRLPAELTSFVGRSSEVDEVARMLAASRLVTLTGVGGSGKSRLALRVATSLADAAPERALLVELGAVNDPALVPQTVANAVGVREEPGRPVVEGLLDALRPRDCLLVLDGCEHLLDPVAALVERLLAETPDVRVLVTSREMLDIPGETVFRVPTLSVPEAGQPVQALADLSGFDGVRLFVERAHAVDAGFCPTDADAAAIAELCRRLDGLPLALELAAARTDVLTLRQLAARLDDRFELLTGGWRTAPPRQRTLRATIAWSYDLLDDGERLLFDRLSVFAGSFTFEGAEAVGAGGAIAPPAVLHLLTSLVRKSLVVRVHSNAATARYRLLDTLRDYARERLRERPDEQAAATARHAAFFLAIAEDAAPFLRGPSASEVMAVLDEEHQEFRTVLTRHLAGGDVESACRLVAALALFWDFRYNVRDGSMWLERVVTAAREANLAPSRALLWATLHAAYFAHRTMDSATAIRRCEEAKTMLAVVPDDVAELRVETFRGEIARYDNDRPIAEEHAARAAKLAVQVGDDWYAGDAFRIVSLTSMDRGDLVAATAAAEECLRRFLSCGDREKMAGSAMLVANLAFARGDYERAIGLLGSSLEGFRQIEEPMGLLFVLGFLARSVVFGMDPEEADRHARECLEVAERLEFVRGLGIGCHGRAEAAFARGDIDAAERWVQQSIVHYREFGFTVDMFMSLPTAVRIYVARGDLDAAMAANDEWIRCARDRDSLPEIGRALRQRAELVLLLDDVDGADLLAHDALALCTEAGDGRGMATALVSLAGVSLRRGRPDEARQRLDDAHAALAAVNGGFSVYERREFARVADALDALDALVRA